jgi:predicted amidophosphoribosyltransferase
MLDLILPLECGGCGAPSIRWCARCAVDLRVPPDAPHLITPRVDPGVPVFSLGRYMGVRRHAIVAMKERGRADLVPPLGGALSTGLEQLQRWGIVETPVTVVPAPTRRMAARRRGGDPVTRIGQVAVAGRPGVELVQALRLSAWTRDSVGLSGADRGRNIAGRVRLLRPVTGAVILVDDIVTTGATAAESTRVLLAAGAHVLAVLTLSHA